MHQIVALHCFVMHSYVTMYRHWNCYDWSGHGQIIVSADSDTSCFFIVALYWHVFHKFSSVYFLFMTDIFLKIHHNKDKDTCFLLLAYALPSACQCHQPNIYVNETGLLQGMGDLNDFSSYSYVYMYWSSP